MRPKLAALRTVREISCANHNSKKLRFFSTSQKLATSFDEGAGCVGSVSGVVVVMGSVFLSVSTYLSVLPYIPSCGASTPCLLIRISMVKSLRNGRVFCTPSFSSLLPHL
jgi:hypothetical protein